MTDSSQPAQQPQTGWICPRCGRSLAPSTTVCPCSSKTEDNQGRRLLFG